MIRQSTFILAILLAFTLSVGAQQNLVLRVFEIEGLARYDVDAAHGAWTLALRGVYRGLSGADDGVEDAEEPGEQGADMLVRMIRDLIDPTSWAEQGRLMRLNESGTRLIVRQTPTNMERIAAFLDAQAAARARGVRLEVLVLGGGAAELVGLGGNRHIVSGERFDRIRAGTAECKILASMTGSARDGQLVVLKAGRVQHFLAAQPAQIAQTAAVSEPQEGKIFEGSEVVIRPLFAPDGRINLRVQARLGSDLGLEPWRSRSPGVGPLQLPSMRQSLFSSSVMLASGEAVVLGAIGSDAPSPRFILLRATADAGADPAFGGSRLVLRSHRCGYLTSPIMSLPRLDLGHLGGGGRLYDDVDREDGVFGSGASYLSGESIMDLVREVVTPDYWDSEPYLLDAEGRRLWIAAQEDQQKGADELLRTLAQERARFLDVEAFCLRIERGQLEAIRRENATTWLRDLLRSREALRLHAMVGSVELGSRIEFAEGLERAWVAEADAEVAQGADILSPAVETGFRGLYLRLAPYALDGERIGLDYDFDLIGPRLDLEAPGGNGVQPGIELRMARSGWASGRGHEITKAGDYLLLAETPGDQEGSVLLVIARMR